MRAGGTLSRCFSPLALLFCFAGRESEEDAPKETCYRSKRDLLQCHKFAGREREEDALTMLDMIFYFFSPPPSPFSSQWIEGSKGTVLGGFTSEKEAIVNMVTEVFFFPRLLLFRLLQKKKL